MSNTYLISEVQLGMLIALKEQKERHELVNQIINLQYVDLPSKNLMDNCILLNHNFNKLRKFKKRWEE